MHNCCRQAPGISAGEFRQRRERLAAALPDGALALFPATPVSYMSHDVPYHPHHQDTDMLWLCGLQEHTSLLACVKPSGGPARWHLFVRPSCPREELWDGARAGVEGAQSFFLPEGAAHAFETAPRVLLSELSGGSLTSLWYTPSSNREIDARLKPTLQSADARALGGGRSARQLVHALRLRKSAAEVALMRTAGAVGAAAMSATMTTSVHAAASGMTEGALAATFEFESKLRGAERLAYPCVVAGGANAVTLHYMHNNAPLRPGEMLLMDAGASVHGYCSDVTRTWPLSGTYSDAQRALYAAVLDVNERVIAAISHERTRNSLTLNALHRMSLLWTLEHLIDLGIVHRKEPHAAARCQRYYPHAIGHWLGLDVHDTPSVDSNVPLEPGMVVTVEPGLYIPDDDELAPAHFRGLGVRIEDDVLIPSRGDEPAEVLTAAVPKRVDQVEALLATQWERAEAAA